MHLRGFSADDWRLIRDLGIQYSKTNMRILSGNQNLFRPGDGLARLMAVYARRKKTAGGASDAIFFAV
jgi:hypothetical protein